MGATSLWELTLQERVDGKCKWPFTGEQLDSFFPGGVGIRPQVSGAPEGCLLGVASYKLQNLSAAHSEAIDPDGPGKIILLVKEWFWVWHSFVFFIFQVLS